MRLTSMVITVGGAVLTASYFVRSVSFSLVDPEETEADLAEERTRKNHEEADRKEPLPPYI